MNQRFKIEYVEGDGGLEVVDLRDSTIAATLNAAGDVFEQNMQGNAEFLVCSAGRSGIRNTPGKASFDAIQRTGNRSGFASGEGSDPEHGTLGDPLPPGAGEPGSSVPDVRVPESETAPSPSSDSPGGSDRQAEHDAARTRNSPRSST